MATVVKRNVLLGLDEELLAEVDLAAREQFQTRTAFVVAAVVAKLRPGSGDTQGREAQPGPDAHGASPRAARSVPARGTQPPTPSQVTPRFRDVKAGRL